MIRQLAVILTALSLTAGCAVAEPQREASDVSQADAQGWWWPTLPAPAGLVRTTPVETFRDPPLGQRGRGDPELGPTHMLVQSAAGLAANAVRRGESDELVWVTVDNPNHELAFDLLNERLDLEDRGQLEPWALVERLKEKGIVKGYVLYRYERSPRQAHRDGEMDLSVNVATSVAGLLGGVIVDEAMEEKAKAMGLERLADVRDKDSQWVWDEYRSQLNRRTAMFQDPKLPHARDYAIAHNVFVLYGHGDLQREVLAWLEPLSPILGWNFGDEGGNAKLFSQYGHFNTATDWAMNLPVLSAGAKQADTPRLPEREPKADGDDDRPVVSFVMSDGDNLQWMVQNFFDDKEPRYWDNPDHGDFPITWTLCLAHMRQAAPDLLRYTTETLPENASAVEFGGGYYFPDHFGELRDEPDLLARQARRTWANMQATGSDILCLIFNDLDSDAAKAAMETYAREMPGLRGILAMQYYPYHAGEGKVFWIDREDGPALPVVTARLELRTDFKLDGTGGVDFIAQRLNEDPMPSQWVVSHAWSSFEVPEGTPEPVPGRNEDDDLVKGLSPVGWTIDQLEGVRAVTVEEMFDRLPRPEEAE